MIYGLVFGWFVFSEAQGLESITGMLLVVPGVILSILDTKRRREIEKIEATVG